MSTASKIVRRRGGGGGGGGGGGAHLLLFIFCKLCKFLSCFNFSLRVFMLFLFFTLLVSSEILFVVLLNISALVRIHFVSFRVLSFCWSPFRLRVGMKGYERQISQTLEYIFCLVMFLHKF